MFILPHELQPVVHRIEALFTTSVSLIAGFAVMICGFRLYIQFKQMMFVSSERHRISRKVATLTLLIAFMFTIRAPQLY